MGNSDFKDLTSFSKSSSRLLSRILCDSVARVISSILARGHQGTLCLCVFGLSPVSVNRCSESSTTFTVAVNYNLASSGLPGVTGLGVLSTCERYRFRSLFRLLLMDLGLTPM